MDTLKEFWKNRSQNLVLIFVIIFPISVKVSNVVLEIMVIDFVISNRIGLWTRITRRSQRIIILLAPFIFLTISVFYSSGGFKNLEKFLPLLIFPILLTSIDVKKMESRILEAFLFSIMGMSVVSMLHALYIFFFLPVDQQVLVGDFINAVPSRWNALTNINLMLPFRINPIYMSLYISFAFYILLFGRWKLSTLKIAGLGFLILFQFLTGSRIGLFAFFVSLVAVPFHLRSKRLKLYFSLGIASVFLLSAFMIIVNPVLEKRFIDDMQAFSPPEKIEDWNALNIRVAIWDCSLTDFKHAPVWGYGLGDQYVIREGCYKEKYTFYGPYGTSLNSHNQYLEFMLIGGTVLLVLFLSQLGYSFKTAIDSGHRLQLIFLILFAVTCFGESLLETHKGIVFFALFNTLFIYTRSTEPNV